MLDRTVVMDVRCPSCGHVIKETVGKLANSPKLPCPRCGAVIDFDGKEIRDTRRSEKIDKAAG
jgi:uncharacterized C2H2 Zn-finger protein